MARWNQASVHRGDRDGWEGYYHRWMKRVYCSLVPPGQRVLEIGCGRGDLLAALKPEFGVGVDFSEKMLCIAVKRHPDLQFIQADAQSLGLKGSFDIIILSDLVNDVWDVQAVFQEAARLSDPRTRLILNFYSRLWELPLSLVERFGLANPTLYQNWLTVEDIRNLLYLTDFEVVRHWREFIWPVDTPLVAKLLNRFLVRLWPIDQLALINFVIARPQPQKALGSAEPQLSVVIPTRNEAGNIANIFKRMPQMGCNTELIFVEGHSTDNTRSIIEQEIKCHPEICGQLLLQTGIGKGDAVRLGFEHASGNILIILDADLTVQPEDLPLFYAVLRSGKAELVNGVRLVYPMEKQAMRFLNMLGNKFFSLVFSWLLGQPIKDTLCGTKALWKVDYEKIAANRRFFGDFDPFGDFDLLFGAAKLNLKIADLPIRYHERIYGATSIDRWKHGMLLLRMALFAAGRIKFY